MKFNTISLSLAEQTLGSISELCVLNVIFFSVERSMIGTGDQAFSTIALALNTTSWVRHCPLPLLRAKYRTLQTFKSAVERPDGRFMQARGCQYDAVRPGAACWHAQRAASADSGSRSSTPSLSMTARPAGGVLATLAAYRFPDLEDHDRRDQQLVDRLFGLASWPAASHREVLEPADESTSSHAIPFSSMLVSSPREIRASRAPNAPG